MRTALLHADDVGVHVHPEGARAESSLDAVRPRGVERPDDRGRAWRRVRKCGRQLGSDPDGLGQPYPEKPAGMLPSRYAWLLDRLDRRG